MILLLESLNEYFKRLIQVIQFGALVDKCIDMHKIRLTKLKNRIECGLHFVDYALIFELQA
jgi:hypothetical protein